MRINRFAGELQQFEGTTAECDAKQEARELFFDTSSGMLRYKKDNGDLVYISNLSSIIGEDYYIPKFLNNSLENSSIYCTNYGGGEGSIDFVGIRTKTPVCALEVSGDIIIRSTGSPYLAIISNEEDNDWGPVYLQGATDASGNLNGDYLNFNTTRVGEGFSFTQQNIPRLTINATGNIGIANPTPGQLLSVGDAVATITSSKAIVIGDATGNPNLLLANDIQNYGQVWWDKAGKYLRFTTKESNTAYQDTMILKGGKVGVATNEPKAQLDVSGDVGVSGTLDSLIYGYMYITTPYTVVVGSANAWYNVSGYLNGPCNQITYDSSKLTIQRSGNYLINWSMSVENVTSNDAYSVIGGVMINSTNIEPNSCASAAWTNNSYNIDDRVTIAGSTIIDLNTNDIINLGLSNPDNDGDLKVVNSTITLTRVGAYNPVPLA